MSKGKQSFENSDEAKNLFVLNLQQCSKVWQAFEKFIND
jgi:type IV secretory pathway component VirB8